MKGAKNMEIFTKYPTNHHHILLQKSWALIASYQYETQIKQSGVKYIKHNNALVNTMKYYASEILATKCKQIIYYNGGSLCGLPGKFRSCSAIYFSPIGVCNRSCWHRKVL